MCEREKEREGERETNRKREKEGEKESSYTENKMVAEVSDSNT